jgi:hypothetical protein
MTRHVLCPPIAKELETTMFSVAGRGWLGT